MLFQFCQKKFWNVRPWQVFLCLLLPCCARFKVYFLTCRSDKIVIPQKKRYTLFPGGVQRIFKAAFDSPRHLPFFFTHCLTISSVSNLIVICLHQKFFVSDLLIKWSLDMGQRQLFLNTSNSSESMVTSILTITTLVVNA